jgi:eukaryotic-like serine/threonine-protein kinase
MAGSMIGVEINGPSDEKFRLTDYLGHGFFGEVYRITGLSSGRIAAVKLIPINTLEDPTAQTALLNEIQVSGQIIHPNVVQVLYVNTGPSSIGPYLIMEFISGGTLAGQLRAQQSANTPIPMPRAREMMIDIAQGARAINERLIHRDIKPDNILIDDTHLKIGDFGISKVIDEQTRTNTFKGAQHIHYMAPEGWESQTNTFKLDVYSVGLVYYQILTLKHPLLQFVSDPQDWREWRKAHLFSVCPDIRKQRQDISIAIAQLIARMVSKRPQDRPGWEEVLTILSSSEEPASQPIPINSAVEIAINRHQQLETTKLAEQQLAEKEARKNELYRYSCEQLTDIFDAIVEQFNLRYQYGMIMQQGPLSHRYLLPNGGLIIFSFFPRHESDLKIKGGQLLGGGYIEVEHSISANVILVSDGDDDLYGRWIGCLLKLGIVNPGKIVGTRGLSEQTVEPFGLKYKQDFYYDIQFAERGTHIFTYDLRTDIQQFLVDLLETALQGPPQHK